jgi:hypothetical protein
MSWFQFGRHLIASVYKTSHVAVIVILACAICASIIFTTLYLRRPRRGTRLSRLIRHERKSVYRLRLWDRMQELLRDFYYPPKALKIVLPLDFLWWGVLFWLRVSPTAANLQVIARLQQLEVGIALVFVPLMIFAVGLSARRSVSGLNLAEVLLAETYLFPIAIFILGLLGAFVFLSTPSQAQLSIFVTLVCASFVLFRLCKTLLDDYYLHSSAVRLLQDKIRRSIGTTVDTRLGYSLLLAELSGTNIIYNPIQGASEHTIFIPSSRQGTVTDIDIDKLLLFSKTVMIAAEEEDVSFAARQERFPLLGSNENTPSIPARRSLTREKPPCIILMLGDEVTDSTYNLMAFPRKAVQDEKVRRRLSKLGREAFVIRRRDSYSQRVRKYMRAVKDEAILAIRDQRTAQLDDLLNVYVSAGDTFLQEMKKLGGYNRKAAERERQNLFGSWAELEWITRDLRELHRRGCLSSEINVVRLVTAIPEKLAHLSIRYGDHLVFDAITYFALYEYHLQDEVRDTKIKELLTRHALTSLQELADYGIVIELRRPNIKVASIESIGSLTTVLLLRFQYLLKMALAPEQVETFRDCYRRVVGLLGTLVRRGEKITIVGTDSMLEEDRESIQQALERNKALQKVARTVEAQKQQMLFSVGSLILEKAVQAGAHNLEPFIAEVPFHLSPADLTSLYLEMCEPEMAELWGNQLLDYPPGGGAVESAHELFARYYSFLLLQSVQNFNVATFGQLRVRSTPELILELSDQGSVRIALSSFATDRDKWQSLIPDVWLSKLADLYAFFESLIAVQLREDEDKLIGAKVDATYLKQFEQRFLKTFVEGAGLRRLFEQFEVYVPLSVDGHLGSQLPRWGANMVDSRESYIDGLRRSSVHWPEEYARDLSLSESQKAFHDILALIPESTHARDGVVGGNEISHLEAELETRGASPDVMLIGGDCSFLYTEEWSHLFVPDWSKTATKLSEIPGFQGVLKLKKSEVPIFQVRTNQDAGTSCLLNFRSGISWRQYPPFDSDAEQEYLRSFFFFHIVDLAVEKAVREKIILDNPVWLRGVQEKDRYLQQRMWLRVLERFEIVSSGSLPGLRFRLVP